MTMLGRHPPTPVNLVYLLYRYHVYLNFLNDKYYLIVLFSIEAHNAIVTLNGLSYKTKPYVAIHCLKAHSLRIILRPSKIIVIKGQ